MFKPTPNPPKADQASSQAKSNTKKLDETAERVLEHYLSPKPAEPKDVPKPGQIFTVAKDVDNECLLANLSETLASAEAMIAELAFDLNGSRRHSALGIQQLIELSSMMANRVLDNVEQR
ncbi:DUF6124 family protein [Pseudomonas sp. SMN5]|uniref:DUF6124 family protein n=1 Tax=Pseudomonas sp. SMN5 TaxID=3390198 RepID=UPI003F838D35